MDCVIGTFRKIIDKILLKSYIKLKAPLKVEGPFIIIIYYKTINLRSTQLDQYHY